MSAETPTDNSPSPSSGSRQREAAISINRSMRAVEKTGGKPGYSLARSRSSTRASASPLELGAMGTSSPMVIAPRRAGRLAAPWAAAPLRTLPAGALSAIDSADGISGRAERGLERAARAGGRAQGPGGDRTARRSDAAAGPGGDGALPRRHRQGRGRGDRPGGQRGHRSRLGRGLDARGRHAPPAGPLARSAGRPARALRLVSRRQREPALPGGAPGRAGLDRELVRLRPALPRVRGPRACGPRSQAHRLRLPPPAL